MNSPRPTCLMMAAALTCGAPAHSRPAAPSEPPLAEDATDGGPDTQWPAPQDTLPVSLTADLGQPSDTTAVPPSPDGPSGLSRPSLPGEPIRSLRVTLPDSDRGAGIAGWRAFDSARQASMTTRRWVGTFMLAWLVGAAGPPGAAAEAPRKFNVRDSGAAGDGKTKDTAAIQKAIDAAAAGGGGEIDFPAGTYLTGSIEVKSHVTLHLEAEATILGSPDVDDYPVAPARWEGIERPCHQALIRANLAEEIAVTGAGTIEGNPTVGVLRHPRAPTIVEPISCKRVRIEGVTLKSTRIWTLHPTYCEDVTISQVKFETAGSNSDGIDPDSCRRVLIDGCTFSTGDDNIAIKSGKGQEGVKMGIPCEDVTITNCTFLKGSASIALGSELSGGIRRVMVSNCTFKNGRAALYLKSRPGRGGYIQDVVASQLVVGPEPLLEIQTTYGSNPDPQGVPGNEGITRFGGIVISNVTADAKSLVKVDATPEKPVEGLALSNISGTCKEGFILRNATKVDISNVKLAGLSGPPFFIENVQGTGLAGAVPLQPGSAR